MDALSRSDAVQEAERLMTICNACRYCEGLCAVFPAMEMRRVFGTGDLDYLANLCHQCGACYSDCQYSPPHEFDVNVPAALARLRNESYARHVWPQAFAGVFERNGLKIAAIVAASIAAFLLGFVALVSPSALWARHAGDFYKVMPHGAMAGLFGLVSLYALIAFVMSLRTYWRSIHAGGGSPGLVAIMQAVVDSFHLTYLHGGGGGCRTEGRDGAAGRSPLRRVFHHLTFYGFLLCFASTTVATIFHYGLNWPAPYPLYAAPVVLGILGGLGLIVGPVGLYVLSRRRDPALTAAPRRDMTTAFIAMLFLTSITGFALMLWRDTAAMGVLLAVHLGVVMALFLTMPYGKFVHGLYRFLALVKYAAEKRAGKFVE